MPTGYTGGILDGKIKNFQEFAVLCARAFGATIHMRDESLNTPYEPRIPSTYHLEGITDAMKEIEKIEKASDAKIILMYRKELKADKKRQLGYIKEKKANKVKLENILADACLYVPPTPEHQGIKDFMKQQITDTIEWDCKTDYEDKEIEKIDKELLNTDIEDIRKKLLKSPLWNLEYHKKEQLAEIKRCEDSNKWVSDYFTSLGL